MARPDWLIAFADESNKIEGMKRATGVEIDALAAFLALPEPTVAALEAYVSVVAPGHKLRREDGVNVRVGSHIAPPGGPDIEPVLRGLVVGVAKNYYHPHDAHVRYEMLHPFTDGNGRSGRALWLWHELNHGKAERAKQLGFLHSFYYDALSSARS